jgi:glycerophosphoryl diester phosphodiesterase
VNDAEIARQEAAAGVDGITTDRPEELRRKLSASK